MTSLRLSVDVLKGEESRLYVLLSDALRCATADQTFGPGELLEALAARRGFNLARSHYHEQRDKKREIAELVRVLRDTNYPYPIRKNA